MTHAGFDVGGQDGQAGAPGPAEPSEQAIAESSRFFNHELRQTTRYLPDVAALTRGPARVVIGIGVDSGHLLTCRTTTALAGLLGTPPVEFPGDHGGFLGHPDKFAKRLIEVLTS